MSIENEKETRKISKEVRDVTSDVRVADSNGEYAE